eukprot:Protomagalhaensia_wolfi_Nauph_80__5062@NODE_537_length_2341_cov_38_978280_g398_i0_p1_GENE_NODE_537_length_2341_cov_38_978280_g398_i0NODE_537_length_2341_cov_38_978280_g398_i0_p1_ORF_typecomplete_len609_score144_11_NODE_537_length_2341_cov_38_978280_g398_i05132132
METTTMAESPVDDSGKSSPRDQKEKSSLFPFCLSKHEPEIVAIPVEGSSRTGPFCCVPDHCVCQDCLNKLPAVDPPSEKVAKSPVKSKKVVSSNSEFQPLHSLSPVISMPTPPRKEDEFPEGFENGRKNAAVDEHMGEPLSSSSLDEGREIGVMADFESQSSMPSYDSCASVVQNPVPAPPRSPPAAQSHCHMVHRESQRSPVAPKTVERSPPKGFVKRMTSYWEDRTTPAHRPVTESPPPSRATENDEGVSPSLENDPMKIQVTSPTLTQSPSPTQLPRNPFPILKDYEVSPSVVPRKVPDLGKSSTAMLMSERLTSVKSFSRVSSMAIRDDLDRELRAALLKADSSFDFIRLKRGFYAVLKPTKSSDRRPESADTARPDCSAMLLDSGFETRRLEKMYYGKAHLAAAQLPPTVFCYVQVTLEFGHIHVAVLSRSKALQHLGSQALRKWLTPDNRFFTQQVGPVMQHQAKRGLAWSLPNGGDIPWRKGEPHRLVDFLGFCSRETTGERSTEPAPARVPGYRYPSFGIDVACHRRRASS